MKIPERVKPSEKKAFLTSSAVATSWEDKVGIFCWEKNIARKYIQNWPENVFQNCAFNFLKHKWILKWELGSEVYFDFFVVIGIICFKLCVSVSKLASKS